MQTDHTPVSLDEAIQNKIKFGRWIVLARDGYTGNRSALVRCRCECGVEKTLDWPNVRKGHSRSCGCLATELRTKHGFCKHPLYATWRQMIHRCYNSSNVGYDKYGGRGITVCERWHAFENFLADMPPQPSQDHTINRIDNDGPYCPENVNWASRTEQQRNMRTNRLVTFNGETHPISEWTEIIGAPSKNAIVERLSDGWSVEDALTRPFKRYKPRAKKPD